MLQGHMRYWCPATLQVAVIGWCCTKLWGLSRLCFPARSRFRWLMRCRSTT